MKRIVSVLLICMAILPILLLYGCNAGFKPVYSITIVTNGSTKTFKSHSELDGSPWENGITFEEYKNKAYGDYEYSTYSEAKKQLYGNDGISKSFKIPLKYRNKTSFYVQFDPARRVNYYSKHYSEIAMRYNVVYWYVKGITYHIIYVKVKNSSTIVIREDNSETTYTVTSYSITYFD